MTGNNRNSPPIVLATDFGTSDAFVGVMKGVILTINPNAAIVDLTHEIGPQDLRQGAFILGANHSFFPPGTVHVAVVDPGVGTERKPILLETPTARFIAPDNGLLSEVVKEYLEEGFTPAGDRTNVQLPHMLKCWELSNPRFQRQPVSNTFHGRDIFAPAAAHLSLGIPPAEFGHPLSEITYNPLDEPVRLGDSVVGEVIYIDHFGNLITNISASSAGEHLPSQGLAAVEIGPRRISGLSRTFHDTQVGETGQPDGMALVALFGSNGYLEVAVRDGSAADSLGLGVGERVQISFAP